MALQPFDITHFSTAADFRAWFEAHHESRVELWVGYWKKATKRASVTWEETVDVALCYGWIDGIRKTVDAESYTIRFTPRRKGSVWSNRNVERYQAMDAAGLVRPRGMAEWEKRTEAKTGIYSFEQGREGGAAPRPADLDDEWRSRLEADDLLGAWEARPPGYRRKVSFWVMSAKKEETRERRFAKLVAFLRGEGELPV